MLIALVLATSDTHAGAPPSAVRVVVSKSERTLEVFSGKTRLASMRIALGRKAGPKQCEGDLKTPEGTFAIAGRKLDSAYHRSLRLSYPADIDRRNARAAGCSPGGDIMIHGLRNGLAWLAPIHRSSDWTRGCIAVTNDEIEVLWRLLPEGTSVEIRA